MKAWDEIFDQRRKQDAVQTALGTLPTELRAAIALVDLEGYSYETAAGMLQIPASTLGVRVFRGRRRLRDLLKNVMGA